MKHNFVLFLIALFVFSSSGCAKNPLRNNQQARIDSVPIEVVTTTQSPVKNPSTVRPTQTPTPNIVRSRIFHEFSRLPPSLWVNIDKKKIEFFPADKITDYAYAKDGSLWIAGGFGVIHQKKDGHQDWYSVKNGLGINGITSLGISPTGEVWVGGIANALFRFSGTKWIDEGANLPPPLDTRKHYLCYTDKILGIDFDDSGNVWVMNGRIELYTRIEGVWMNFPFPKELLPMSGGGACPIGFRAVSNKDITIKINGCCGGGPQGKHYDGSQWTNGHSYSKVDKGVELKHQPYRKSLDNPTIDRTGDISWPFQLNHLLPTDWDKTNLFLDNTGVLWLSNNGLYYKYVNDQFLQTPYTIDLSTNPDFRDPRRQLIDDEREWVNEFAPYYQKYYTSPEKESIGVFSNISEDRFLISANGVIWEIENGNWRELITTKTSPIFRFLTEDSAGGIIAATDTSVSEFFGASLTEHEIEFIRQDEKPMISGEREPGGCPFNKYYVTIGCYTNYDSEPKVHYSALALSTLDDGSIVFVNNHIIAKRENYRWKSFFFDTLEFTSAVVDLDGYIWVTANDGLIRFSPDIFDNYESNEIFHN